MNQILSGIYGTGGHEKVATEGGHAIGSLSDLAAVIASEMGTCSDLQKTAAVHGSILEELGFYDLSGRAAAQAEFSQLEKAAAAGDTAPLEAFFAEQSPTQETALQAAISEELSRRQ